MKLFRQGVAGGIAKMVLLGLMTLAVAGLVMMDIGGFFRDGGISNNNVIKVGHENVSINQFDRTLRQASAQANMTPQQAYQMGLADRLISSEVQSKLLALAAHENGILIGRPHIAKQISQMIMPAVQPGQNPHDVLSQILRTQGMSEKDFVKGIGEQAAGNVLISAVQSGFAAMNPELARELAVFQKEKRDVEYVTFLEKDIKIAEPTEEQIAGIYELRKQKYAEPEMRTFKIVRIKNESLKNNITVSDEEIQNAYDDNIDAYKTDENRVFEQAIVNSEEKAKKIAEAAAKTDLKAAVKNASGTTSDYAGEENTLDAKLLPEIKEKIEAVKNAGDVIGPVESPLGWHVIKITKIFPASTRSLEEVRNEIVTELKENKLAEEQGQMIGTVEDMLAGGTSLEEINKEVPLDITTLPPVNRNGVSANGNNALDAYKDSAKALLESGFQLEQGAASSMIEMNDGNAMAVYLDAVKPETFKPLKDVSAELKQDWVIEQRKIQGRVEARDALESMKDRAALEAYASSKGKALQKVSGLVRDQEKAPITPAAMTGLFEAELNKPLLIDIDGGVAIAAVTSSEVPDSVDTGTKEYKELSQGLEQSLQNEAMLVYLNEKQDEYKVKVNAALLERVYGQNSADMQP